MRAVIQAICAVQFLTLQQMGALLNRKSKDKLYSNYVKPMVNAGILELRYPDKPNHKDQA